MTLRPEARHARSWQADRQGLDVFGRSRALARHKEGPPSQRSGAVPAREAQAAIESL
jgi:hypothetical protein